MERRLAAYNRVVQLGDHEISATDASLDRYCPFFLVAIHHQSVRRLANVAAFTADDQYAEIGGVLGDSLAHPTGETDLALERGVALFRKRPTRCSVGLRSRIA